MIILTIDTDWAPEEATLSVLEKVKSLGIKCTVFFSTPSPLPYWPLLEVACHPDLSRRRVDWLKDKQDDFPLASMEENQAVDEAESGILASYRDAFPQAKAIRTHRFYWHSDLSRNLLRFGFEHDSSMILPYHPGLRGFKVGRLHRWPVFASDHLHLARRLPLDSLKIPNLDQAGLKVFCFHVAYLHLNASSLEDFNMIKQQMNGEDCQPAKTSKAGIWDLFELLAERIYKHSQGSFLKEISPEYIVPHKG